MMEEKARRRMMQEFCRVMGEPVVFKDMGQCHTCKFHATELRPIYLIEIGGRVRNTCAACYDGGDPSAVHL